MRKGHHGFFKEQGYACSMLGQNSKRDHFLNGTVSFNQKDNIPNTTISIEYHKREEEG